MFILVSVRCVFSIFYSIFRICIFVTFCCIQSVAFCGFLVPFQRIFQHFYPMQPPILPAFLCQFLGIFSLPLLFFLSFLQYFSTAPFVNLYFILVKVAFYFLEFQLEFLFVLAICYCNQSMSIIFSCIHHFLISPVWKQQQKQDKTEQLER